MSDRACGGGASVDELQRDWVCVQEGLQLMLDQDGGVNEAVRRARVDEGFNLDERLARDLKMDLKGKVAGERGKERRRGLYYSWSESPIRAMRTICQT